MRIVFTLCIIMLSVIFQITFVSAQENKSQNTDDQDIEKNIDKLLKDSEKKEDAGKTKKITLNHIIDRISIPNIFVAADFVGERDINNGREDAITKNGFFAREIEFGFSTAIDHLALGNVLFAVHNEAGQYFVELHEAYFEFNKLPLNLYLKLGRFFLDAGRLNTIHRHDWDFTNAPLVHEKLFDLEGVYDQGGELSLLIPLPFYQELKIGVFNGRTWGHTHGDGPVKPYPLVTGRLKNFFPIYGKWGTQFGFTYIRYSVDEEKANIDNSFGADLTVKWKKGRYGSFIFTYEIWYRTEEREDTALAKKFGWYGYMMYQVFQQWYVGARIDYFAEVGVYVEALDKKINRTNKGQSMWITYRPSEFSYFRLTGEREDYYETDKVNYAAYIQADFIIGYHPAHKY